MDRGLQYPGATQCPGNAYAGEILQEMDIRNLTNDEGILVQISLGQSNVKNAECKGIAYSDLQDCNEWAARECPPGPYHPHPFPPVPPWWGHVIHLPHFPDL